MLSRIATLERLMAELPKQYQGIGHNRPPISDDDIEEIKQAVASLSRAYRARAWPWGNLRTCRVKADWL
jgi:hypothetical protein